MYVKQINATWDAIFFFFWPNEISIPTISTGLRNLFSNWFPLQTFNSRSQKSDPEQVNKMVGSSCWQFDCCAACYSFDSHNIFVLPTRKCSVSGNLSMWVWIFLKVSTIQECGKTLKKLHVGWIFVSSQNRTFDWHRNNQSLNTYLCTSVFYSMDSKLCIENVVTVCVNVPFAMAIQF